MPAYKYYAREVVRHAEAKAAKVTRHQMVELTEALCFEFNQRALPVYFSDRLDSVGLPMKPASAFHDAALSQRIFKKANWSWFSHAGFFSYGVAMFDVLTVAHEVAHYLHRQECKRENRKYVPHGKEHAMWVDRCVAFLKRACPEIFTPKTETLQVAFTKVAGEIVEVAKDPIKAFYDSLPERLTCPCCNATLPKMNFGVRVMKRDADNNPTAIRRQSYCRACR